jgi:HSP20 family molecular chaperone IbpA
LPFFTFFLKKSRKTLKKFAFQEKKRYIEIRGLSLKDRSLRGSISAEPLVGNRAESAKEFFMKNARGYMDMGTVFDEIFEAARNFHDEFSRNFNSFGNERFGRDCNPHWPFDENIDYYPNYSYPPMNVFMTADRSMVFEFALAGFDEKNISLSFQGDYMVFSAKFSETAPEKDSATLNEDNPRYFKRRLKLKDIETQKYFVPHDKYAQENVKAVFKNGILKVIVPPKDEPDTIDGVKIEILKEGM